MTLNNKNIPQDATAVDESIPRIKEYVHTKDLTLNAFYKKANLPVSYFNNTKIPSAGILRRIQANYPDLNVEWVLNGKGDMLKRSLPVYNLDIQAKGFLHPDRVVEYLHVPGFEDCDGWVIINRNLGHSSFQSGDKAAFKSAHKNDIFWGKAHLIVYNDGSEPQIRLIKKGADSDHVFVISESVSSQTGIEIKLSTIKELFRLRGGIINM